MKWDRERVSTGLVLRDWWNYAFIPHNTDLCCKLWTSGGWVDQPQLQGLPLEEQKVLLEALVAMEHGD